MNRTITLLFAVFPYLLTAQIIDEIQFNPPGTDDEWVEICNPTTSNLSLANFRLLIDNNLVFTFPLAASIPAEGCITIGLGDDGDETNHFNHECPFTPTYLRAGLVINGSTANTNVLPNSTGQVTLQNANGIVVDEVRYDAQHISSGDLADSKTFTLFELAAENSSTGNFNWVASLDAGGSPNLPANANCPSARTELSFTTTAGRANEDAGTLNTTVCVKIARPSFNLATRVEVALTVGNATNGTDIEMFQSPITLEFPAGSFSTQCLEITVTDDDETEGIETLNFILQNPAGGRNMATLGENTTFALSIIDDDYTDAVINEILFNPLGNTADNEREFFEIRGQPNASLAGIWLIEVDGDGSSAGRINAEIDLSDYTLGSNGLLLVRDVGMAFTPTPAAETSVVEMDFGSSIFQNGTGTFLLMTSHNDNINDLDDDNDGSIDMTSWNTILDAVSITDGGANDFVYAELLGGTDLPRHQNNVTAHGVFRSSTDEWLAATSQAGNSGSFEFDFATVWNNADTAFDIELITPSQFTPGNDAPTALPLATIDFFATQQNDYPLLEWNISTTNPPAFFKLYRSSDRIIFSPITSIPTALHKTHYRFVDTDPQAGVNYYQLRWIDDVGQAQHSKIVQIKYEKSGEIKVHPTVVHQGGVTITNVTPPTDITIFDALGQIVTQQQIFVPNTTLQLPKEGIYYLQIEGELFRVIRVE